jgi:hypothetical protein
MLVKLNALAEKVYSKLYVSSSDIRFARYCASVLLKKGWHAQPWERRGTIYQQQAVFTTALVTAYARPFTSSKGWPKLPSNNLIAYSVPEQILHKQLLRLRHTVYAHSASASYSIQPWRSGNFSTDIVGAPVLRITSADANLFMAMTSKLLASIDLRMKALLPGQLAEPAPSLRFQSISPRLSRASLTSASVLESYTI